MFSKTLIVSLLAFLCLQICIADRLNTRIAGPFASAKGQFPYIAFVTYNYPGPNGLTSQQSTGIIYSQNSVITTANVFNNFQSGATDLVIEVAAFDINLPGQFFVIPNATVGTYAVPTTNGTVPPVAGNSSVLIPTQFVKGQSSFDVAIIRLNAPDVFNFSNREISIANFPTSSPVPSDQLNAVAYGSQAPNATAFPVLKYAGLNLKRNNKCVKALNSSGGLNTLFNANQHFCIQSQATNQTNGTYEGVCRNDIGGAVVRSTDITKPSVYYEVLGLISYANDTTTCDAAVRTPAIVIYLSYFQDKFFTPVLGSLSAVGNKQNATLNPDSNRGNFICGNGVIDTPYEKCDPPTPADQPCCNTWICAWKPAGKKCGTAAENNATKDVCLTKKICDFDGSCARRNRDQGKNCAGVKGSVCREGKCKKCKKDTTDATEVCVDV